MNLIESGWYWIAYFIKELNVGHTQFILFIIHELSEAAPEGLLPTGDGQGAHPEGPIQYELDNKVPFSEYFRVKDQQEIWGYEDRKVMNKKYRSLVDRWKKPLEKKRLRQARIK